MGFTGLARWINTTGAGLEMISENILRNQQGTYLGKWLLFVRSYRSNGGITPGPERLMWAITMNDNVFVLLEDPAAPLRADSIPKPKAQEGRIPDEDEEPFPPHRRNTFVTLSPGSALESLFSQTKASWVPVRQGGARATAAAQPLIIEGSIFKIGTDWVVRAGNVILPGGTVKGMLVEAEYLPLPTLASQAPDGASELLSNLLTSVLPPVPGAKTVAVTISDAQWEEVLGLRGEEEKDVEEDVIDDVYVYGIGEMIRKKSDWTGHERERRAAFLIIGALKSELIL